MQALRIEVPMLADNAALFRDLVNLASERKTDHYKMHQKSVKISSLRALPRRQLIEIQMERGTEALT